MTLQITRDESGLVTITNPETGRTEVLSTSVANRPSQRTVLKARDLPSHQWGRSV
jgi:hypothetical protein